MKNLDPKPIDKQLDWLYEAVTSFHRKVASKMQGYLKIALQSLDVEKRMSAHKFDLISLPYFTRVGGG